MNQFKRLSAFLLCFILIFTSAAFATEEFETEIEELDAEEVEAFIGTEEDEEEEKEYLVYFNDSVVTLYADEGKDYAVMNEEELAECLEEGVVDFYEENSYVYLYDESGFDPMQGASKWDIKFIKADYAFDLGYTGSGVKVAVIDSGCNQTGDLSSNILEGYNLVANSTDVTDEVGHGTIVSAQIAAEVNSVGFRGVAPNVKIVPLKIFEDRKAKVELLADAIKMAVDDYDCDIINMSLGGKSDSVTLKAAVEYAKSKNVLLIAAAGNDGNDSYSYPASYAEVVSVSAVDNTKTVCSYSQYNDGVTVCAPGGTSAYPIYCISPSGNDKYLKSYGTSFAAPLVTGIAAIFRGLDSDFTHEDFMEIIVSSSVDLGKSGYDTYYGYGMADVEKYLKFYFAPVGDNNADGYVTNDDAMRVLKHIMGSFPTFVKPGAADVDDDGVVTLLDAILVARIAAGWENVIPDKN